MVAVAWSGSTGTGERWRHRAPISEGLSGQVISTGRVVAADDGPQTYTGSQLAPMGAQALLGGADSRAHRGGREPRRGLDAVGPPMDSERP
jgi:hypothetical protein